MMSPAPKFALTSRSSLFARFFASSRFCALTCASFFASVLAARACAVSHTG